MLKRDYLVGLSPIALLHHPGSLSILVPELASAAPGAHRPPGGEVGLLKIVCTSRVLVTCKGQLTSRCNSRVMISFGPTILDFWL